MDALKGFNPDMLKNIASGALGAVTGKSGKANSRDPYIKICNEIKSNSKQIQEALTNKLSSAQFNQSEFFNEQYKSIADKLSDEIIRKINSIFDNDNLRIVVLLAAKKMYEEKGMEDIFQKSNKEEYFELLKQQIEQTIGTAREQTGGKNNNGNPLAGLDMSQLQSLYDKNKDSFPSDLKDTFGKALSGLSNGQTGNAIENIQNAIPGASKLFKSASNPANSASTNSSVTPENTLTATFDKIFGDGEFQDAVGNIILKRIEQIVIEKKIVDTILSKQIEEVANSYQSQFSKLAEVLSGDSLACLFIIQTLSEDLLKNYTSEGEGTTIGDYLEKMVLSKKELSTRSGGTKRRRNKRRTHKKRHNKNKNSK